MNLSRRNFIKLATSTAAIVGASVSLPGIVSLPDEDVQFSKVREVFYYDVYSDAERVRWDVFSSRHLIKKSFDVEVPIGISRKDFHKQWRMEAMATFRQKLEKSGVGWFDLEPLERPCFAIEKKHPLSI